MKKILLLTVAIMFFTCTAFGSAVDLNGEWNVTIPQQYVTTSLGALGTVPTSYKEFQITVSGGAASMVETTPGELYPINTPTGVTGTASGNMINPMGTSGLFLRPDPTRAFPTEIQCNKILDDPTFSDSQLLAAQNLPANVNAGLLQDWDHQYYGFLFYQVDLAGVGIPDEGYWVSCSQVFYMERVPVPACLGLLLAGMVGLIAVRRNVS